MIRHVMGTALAVALTAAALVHPVEAQNKRAERQIERGKYLVTIMSCTDCHTPGYFLGKPDNARVLGGSDVGFKIPPGVVHGPNLTNDKETGLGNWTDAGGWRGCARNRARRATHDRLRRRCDPHSRTAARRPAADAGRRISARLPGRRRHAAHLTAAHCRCDALMASAAAACLRRA